MLLVSQGLEPNYLIAIEALSLSQENDSDTFINTVMEDHLHDFVADLVASPKLKDRYQQIAEKLKARNSLEAGQSFEYIQRIARCLENSDFEALENLNCQMSHLIPDLKIVSRIKQGHHIQELDIQELEQISHPRLKSLILANFINVNQIALKDLKLSKKDILRLGPYLNYVDCRGCFDQDFNIEEIDGFIESCSHRVKTLIIDNKVTKLPRSLPLCEILICKKCIRLHSLPDSIPNCKILDCSECDLSRLPELPLCQSLNCCRNPKLKLLPELPSCQTLDCSYCPLKSLPDLANCQTLYCYNCNRLVELSSLPKCETLDCQNCLSLIRLPARNVFKFLFISGNSSLRLLPRLDHCRVLYSQGCKSLLQLPDLPLCEQLHCNLCPLLCVIPQLDECVILNCSGCKNLKLLRGLPKCENLNSSYCFSLEGLPNLISIKSLNCSYCCNLRKLSEMNSVEIFDCSYCLKLTELPELPSCEYLNCSHNPLLKNFRSLPKCQKLTCDACDGLTELPELKVCQIVSCQNCCNLKRIFDLPECQSLICLGCINLEKIPALQVCENIYCNGCLKLTNFPELLMCERLCYDVTEILDISSIPERFKPLQYKEHPTSLQVYMKELTNNPLNVLLRLRDFVFERRFMPEIHFIEDDERAIDAEDAGGVSRVFLSKLMESLILNSEKNNQLNFRKMISGLYMPIIDPERNLRLQIKGFQILGSIFDLCLRSQGIEFELSTGIIFDQELFKQILSLTYKELNQIKFEHKKIPIKLKLELIANSSDATFSRMGKLLLKKKGDLSFEEFEELRHIIFHDIDDEEKVPEDFYPRNFHKRDLNEKEWKEMIPWICHYVAKMITKTMDPQILPLTIIAKELQSRIGNESDFKKLIALGDSHLSHKIQGEISKEIFIEAIQFFYNEENIEERKFNQIKSFIEKWILDENTTIQDLMNLCSFITGSPTLKSTKLNIYLYNRDPMQLPISRTCFNMLELTVDYPNYETFKTKLETAINSAANSETAALEFR